jgi:hypothetical protein
MLRPGIDLVDDLRAAQAVREWFERTQGRPIRWAPKLS